MSTHEQIVNASRNAHRRMAHAQMCVTLTLNTLSVGNSNQHVVKMLTANLDEYDAEYEAALSDAVAADKFLSSPMMHVLKFITGRTPA